MSKQRIAGPKAFAWQFVQECLRNHHIPREFSGMMTHSTMVMGDDQTNATAWTLVCISGARCNISANLTIHRDTTDDPWISGTCDLHMVDTPDKIWKFTARVEDNRLVVELLGHPGLAEPEYVFASAGPDGPDQHD